MALLEIKNLNVSVGEKEILKDFSFSLEQGKVYALLGPNGCGKSTLSGVIAGNPVYTVNSGSILFKGKNLFDMKPSERACAGIFLGFQYPVEINGVSYAAFLKQAINSRLKAKGEKAIDAVQFMKRLKTRALALGISDEMLKRFVNVGFSGGEKKKMETLQMAFLEPDFCILDEMDSGLDVDAMRVVANGVSIMREEHRSFLVISHYDNFLELIKPDVVMIMAGGHIVKTGGMDLVQELKEKGYAEYK